MEDIKDVFDKLHIYGDVDEDDEDNDNDNDEDNDEDNEDNDEDNEENDEDNEDNDEDKEDNDEDNEEIVNIEDDDDIEEKISELEENLTELTFIPKAVWVNTNRKRKNISTEDSELLKKEKRKKCYDIFHNFFKKDIIDKFGKEYSFDNSDKIAKNIEKSINNYAITNMKLQKEQPSWMNYKFIKEYHKGYFKVISNIKLNPNALNVLDSIKSGELKPRDIVCKTHRELAPIKWEEVDKLASREIIRDNSDKIADGMFKCGRCKSTKTTNTQFQSRSADESMTLYIRCSNCGNRWKC